MSDPIIQDMLNQSNDAASKLQSLMDVSINIARNTIEDGEENLPQWILQDAEGGTSIFITPWSDDREKNMISIIIRAQIRKEKAVRLVFVSECWVVSAGLGETIDCQPSQHPRRQEILMVNGEDKDGVQISKHFPILRPGNTLGDEIIKGEYYTMRGRFANMFT